jgi:hypothetical protein
VLSRRKHRLPFIAKQLAAIFVATVGLAVTSTVPANALYDYQQGFETQSIGWYWGLVGSGSGDWYTGICGQPRTGCGGVIIRHAATGYVTLYTTVHLDAFNYGYCSIGYYARLWKSTGPATARLEILNPDFTYIALTDKVLTNSTWTYIGTGFYQFAARDVKIRMTLPGSGSTANNDVGINMDDLSVHCRVLIQGRG